MAAWLWLFCLFLSLFAWIPALIGVLAAPRHSFVNQHARRAMNMWLTELLLSLLMTIAMLFLYKTFSTGALISLRLLGFVLIYVWHLLRCLHGAWRAHHGRPYAPSFTFTFLR